MSILAEILSCRQVKISFQHVHRFVHMKCFSFPARPSWREILGPEKEDAKSSPLPSSSSYLGFHLLSGLY